MADRQSGEIQAIRFDPAAIPADEVERLAADTLRMVRWMLTIPTHRTLVLELAAALRSSRRRETA